MRLQLNYNTVFKSKLYQTIGILAIFIAVFLPTHVKAITINVCGDLVGTDCYFNANHSSATGNGGYGFYQGLYPDETFPLTVVGTPTTASAFPVQDIVPGDNYWFVLRNVSGIDYWYQVYVADGNAVLANESGTRIAQVTPTNGATVATSTAHTIGAGGTLSGDDFNSGSQLRIHLENSQQSFTQCADVICSQLQRGSISRDFTYSLVIPGSFTYSSTTAGLPVGKYWVTTTILKGSFCLFDICLSTSNVISTSTTFIVSTTTKADRLKDNVIDHLNSLSGPAGDLTACHISTLDLFACGTDLIDYAFVPTSDALQYTVNRVKNNILAKPPFGYVTRFIDIMTSTTSVALPDTSFPIPFGGTGGNMEFATITDFQADDMINGASAVMDTIKDPRSGQTLRQIVEPIFKVIIWLIAWIVVIKDILGMQRHKQTL